MSPLKKFMPTLAAVMIILAPISCSKNAPTENGSEGLRINRMYHAQTPLIPDSEFAFVRTLFRQNNLDLSNLQIYSFQSDQGSSYVRAYQFYLGLQFFMNDMVFVFDQFGTLSSRSGASIGSFPLDTMPIVSMHDAAILYDSLIAADSWYKDSLSTFRRKGFDAELGIYDLNVGRGYGFPDYILSWKLTVNGRGEWPVGYMMADSSKVIYYSNGIIIN